MRPPSRSGLHPRRTRHRLSPPASHARHPLGRTFLRWPRLQGLLAWVSRATPVAVVASTRQRRSGRPAAQALAPGNFCQLRQKSPKTLSKVKIPRSSVSGLAFGGAGPFAVGASREPGWSRGASFGCRKWPGDSQWLRSRPLHRAAARRRPKTGGGVCVVGAADRPRCGSERSREAGLDAQPVTRLRSRAALVPASSHFH